MKADAALETARSVAVALGTTPLLSVASDLQFSRDGVRPDPDARSLAERIQDARRGPGRRRAPFDRGREPRRGAAERGRARLRRRRCGEGARSGARGEGRRGPRPRRGPACERPHAGGADRGDRQPEPPLPRARRNRRHRRLRGVIEIFPVDGLPEIGEGDDLGAMIAARRRASGRRCRRRRAEGRLQARGPDRRASTGSSRARARASSPGRDTDLRQLEAILQETARVVRSRDGLVIAETRHGFVCASAGVDHSNAAEPDTVILLPLDPDASARRIRTAIARAHRFRRRGDRHRLLRPPVSPRDDRRRDRRRRPRSAARPSRDRATAPGVPLRTTQVALADELAAAADLVRTTKADGLPVVIVRGVRLAGDGAATELVIPADRDLFR